MKDINSEFNERIQNRGCLADEAIQGSLDEILVEGLLSILNYRKDKRIDELLEDWKNFICRITNNEITDDDFALIELESWLFSDINTLTIDRLTKEEVKDLMKTITFLNDDYERIMLDYNSSLIDRLFKDINNDFMKIHNNKNHQSLLNIFSRKVKENSRKISG